MTKKLDLKATSACISNYRKYRQAFFKSNLELLSVSNELQANFKKNIEEDLKNTKLILTKFNNSRLGMFDIWRNIGFSANENNFSDGIASLLDPHAGHKLYTEPIKKLLLLLEPLKKVESTIINILSNINNLEGGKISVVREKCEDNSRPDIEIFSQDFIIFIENKLRGTPETFRNKFWQTDRMVKDLKQKAMRFQISEYNSLGIFLTPEGKKSYSNNFINLSLNEFVNAMKSAVRESRTCPSHYKQSIISFLEYYSKE
jgi:hypothetical protein